MGGGHGTGALDRVMLEIQYVINLIQGKKYTQLVEAIALSPPPDDNASPSHHDEVRVHPRTNLYHHLPLTDLVWRLNDHIVW